MAIIMLMAAAGCDATWQRFRSAAASPADQYRSKAETHEKASELQQALLAWRIAGELDPGDAASDANIQRIAQQIARKARTHYQKGLHYFRTGQPVQARREFLTVLRTDPTHRQALDRLKKHLQHPHRSVYKVRPGDSYTRIATTIYHDPSKAYVVAHFNDLDPRKPLLIGTALILPQLDPKYLYPRSDIEALLKAARRASSQKQYAQAISLTAEIIKELPGHAQARQLAATVRFEYGMQLMRRGHYHAALEQLKLTPPHHKGRRKAMIQVQDLISQQAMEEKLTAARRQLKHGDHTAVIAITEPLLADDPENNRAKALQNEAGYQLGKALIEEGRPAQAIGWLEKVDAAYADTALQLSLARARIKAAAEEHYRNGVRHFINENLEAAIKAWQQALELNPGHPKARQDMQNAMHLLEKWRNLERIPPGKPTID